MTTPELHVDDLLDREARGVLSAAERGRLEEHLAACSVCRFERQVRADFRAEFESLAGASQSEPRDVPQAAPVARARASRAPARARSAFVLLAGALLLAGAAAAELARERGWAVVGVTVSPSATEPLVEAARAPRRNKRAAARPSAETEPSAEPAETEPSAEPAPSAAPVDVPAASSAKVATLSVPASPSARAAAATEAARALFGDAGGARERGDYELAVWRYTELLRLYPGSAQAAAAHAILGRLLLDRGDPRGALVHFEAYLASGASSLTEEALLGRALAFGELGQPAQESNAWRALLDAYPGSLHAARARQRLSALQVQ